MANIEAFLSFAMQRIVDLSAFSAAGLTKRDIGRRFRPQTQDLRPEDYPAVALIYDYDGREDWAAIDALNLIIQITMKEFEDARVLSEEIRSSFHLLKESTPDFVLYGCFHRGGTPQPMYNKQYNNYESMMTFESKLG